MMFEFHVRKYSRSKYQLDQNLFSISGDLVIANFRLARTLADKINRIKKAEGKNDQQTSAGQINAFGLMHEIFHYLVRYYEEKENPGVFSRGIDYLRNSIDSDKLDNICTSFLDEFPPLDVFNGKISAHDYLNGFTGSKPNREVILEELLLLHLENINPAASQIEELYTDKYLSAAVPYSSLLVAANDFFMKEKTIGKENLSLLAFLKKPILSSPHSIDGQLEFIRTNWGIYIPQELLDKLLRGKDLILEELKLFLQFGGGKPTPPVPTYEVDEEYLRLLKEKLARGEMLTDDESRFYYSEIEKFTEDIDWMPKVVMIAKNVFVWLDQLSKKYGRPVTRLDQIPDEELDALARWNFTALWLIGIWERSSASKKIKQLTGNPDAAPSAYSLYDYVIADELGGEDAFQNLKARAWQRGIRLASDMVPNHTGIYSKWVVEKPDYFLQSDFPPYPGYTFNGPNLSDDLRVEVRIEDKYYTREDAAVVFQRRDAYTGDIKYFYHGNDGTHMPWNDTSQLNLLNPETREALIQTIMHVARKFPIIRFDAAMTLAKKHYQRLWYPQPGTGGAIPSRSDYSMTREAFDTAMPDEFWREVVDRINSEMPDTLLLAEAFWLMEGYFVRTLGMHRVYNSAFMHMLMKEENSKYHELIRNTLEFNPEILKRYVNFMSNPDEETAVNQFGKGDKYFGIAVMMVTLPGLPMFAHGQIEGYSEKYGMEYKRAYYGEYPDGYLVHRHETEIFPLLQKRYLFSQVRDFEFFEFTDEFGSRNENVFAYANKSGEEHVLVIYNNAYQHTSGSINYSSGKVEREGNRNIKVRKAAEALGFNYHYKNYYIFKDHRTKLEHIVSSTDIFENGFRVSLEGYEYKAFIDFREVYDENDEYRNLCQDLYGAGVPSIDEALIEMKLSPVHDRLQGLFNYDFFETAMNYCFAGNQGKKSPREKVMPPFVDPSIESRITAFIYEANRTASISIGNDEIINQINNQFYAVKNFDDKLRSLQIKKTGAKSLEKIKSALTLYSSAGDRENIIILLLYAFIKSFLDSSENQVNNFFSSLHLEKVLGEILKSSGCNVEIIHQNILLIKVLIIKEQLLADELFTDKYPPHKFITELISGKEACEFVMLNEFGSKIYFNKERMENLCNWLYTIGSILLAGSGNGIKTGITKTPGERISLQKKFEKLLLFFEGIKNASIAAGYSLKELESNLKKAAAGIASKNKVVKERKKTRGKQSPGRQKKR